MNVRGSMENVIEAMFLLMMAIIVLFVVMQIWAPITTLYLYPLLNNTAAFSSGPIAVILLQLFVLVVAASLLFAFFSHVKGEGRRPPTYYG